MLYSPHPAASQAHSSDHVVEEILLVGLGFDQTQPYILVSGCFTKVSLSLSWQYVFVLSQAIINKELVVYKAYPYHLSNTPSHLQLRFSKVSICCWHAWKLCSSFQV